MKIFFPQNIFTSLIYNALPENIRKNIFFRPSSLITKEIIDYEKSAGLIPIMDLIPTGSGQVNNKDLFVSQSFGISFEGSLNNTYIYFTPAKEGLKEISLSGDVSSTEVILTRILFKELYDSTVDIHIVTDEKEISSHNLILVGDKNLTNDKILSSVSFSEEIIEMTFLPFVNYILASKEKSVIENVNKIFNGISNSIYNEVEKGILPGNYSEEIKSHIQQNISSLVIDFDPNDLEGIEQLLRLPYFHGMIDDILDIKFV